MRILKHFDLVQREINLHNGFKNGGGLCQSASFCAGLFVNLLTMADMKNYYYKIIIFNLR